MVPGPEAIAGSVVELVANPMAQTIAASTPRKEAVAFSSADKRGDAPASNIEALTETPFE